LPVHLAGVVPGHQAVGKVVGVAQDLSESWMGQLVGVAWLRSTCGSCRFCRRGAENLCPDSTYTGWDADGGYAEYLVVPAAFAYPLPNGIAPERAAPLLCAGIIGYRSLVRAKLPAQGRLGLYGFGASAHLTAQLAIAQGARVHVFTRAPEAGRLALEIGAMSANPVTAPSPEPLDAAILFAPVGDLVPIALESLDRGGTLAIAGIHLTDVPALSYQRHLFQERTLRSVTANTREDGRRFLQEAASHHIAAHVEEYPFNEADRALMDLARDRITGVAVLRVGETV
jgi:propanol-preferring alcohol dehydrogenase